MQVLSSFQCQTSQKPSVKNSSLMSRAYMPNYIRHPHQGRFVQWHAVLCRFVHWHFSIGVLSGYISDIDILVYGVMVIGISAVAFFPDTRI